MSHIQEIMYLSKVNKPLSVYRVHWLKAKAQKDRWAEEVTLLTNEMDWVSTFFRMQASMWNNHATSRCNGKLGVQTEETTNAVGVNLNYTSKDHGNGNENGNSNEPRNIDGDRNGNGVGSGSGIGQTRMPGIDVGDNLAAEMLGGVEDHGEDGNTLSRGHQCYAYKQHAIWSKISDIALAKFTRAKMASGIM